MATPIRPGLAGFFTQVFNRVRRAGNGLMTLRADSGFDSSKVTQACEKRE